MIETNDKNFNLKEQKEIWSDPEVWTKAEAGEEWSSFFGSTANLWATILPHFSKYMHGDMLEIAPGYGRITDCILKHGGVSLSVVDISEICIERCKEKFGDLIVSYDVNDGKSLPYADGSFDFVFSYDSFVHIIRPVIEDYLQEIKRVLRPGGYAFIHHANFYGGNVSCRRNRAGRMNMTPEIFRYIVHQSGMEVVAQSPIQVSELIHDTLTTFKKLGVGERIHT